MKLLVNGKPAEAEEYTLHLTESELRALKKFFYYRASDCCTEEESAYLDCIEKSLGNYFGDLGA